MSTALIVHGGAGKFEPEHEARAKEGCREALLEGKKLLDAGSPALDVVERVVSLLEDNPTFDAGLGSFPNADGHVEMDAIIVDGATLEFGAVAAIQQARNPISVARAVMVDSPHAFIVGQGATRFALDRNFETVPHEDFAAQAVSGPRQGTVGAVALDIRGNLATATSTGGTAKKHPGRVGDSPLIGAGAIADNAIGAASATGVGEDLMRILMARTAWDFMRIGQDAMRAARSSVGVLEERIQGRGGVICIDPSGGVGWAHNTKHLAVAAIDTHGEITVAL